ncbi:MAG: CHC2 zinc finger domain-containing protein, partial [Rhodospirillales bacterium]
MTAADIAHALRGRRSGAGWMARCPAHDDRSPSLAIHERDGRVLVHCFAGCGQEAVIEALRERGLWPERERRKWTPAERRQWARERRAFEQDLREAWYWRQGVVVLLELDLDREKAKLFSGDEPADVELIRSYTRLIARLEGASDEALVAEYREWRAEMPEQCAGIVRWAQAREAAEVRAL